MMTKNKHIGFIVTLVAAFFIGSWGVVYASTAPVLEVNPPSEALVANDRPTISAKWTKSPDFEVKSFEIRVDGKPRNAQMSKDGTSVTVRLRRRLSQGRHTAKARLVYGLDTTQQVETKWKFTVDTKPPPVALANGARLFASRTSNANITAKSEVGAQVAVTLNKIPVKNQVITNRKGKLKIRLRKLRTRNKLRLTATDAAGNIRSVVFPVVQDKTAPTIAETKPAQDELVKEVKSPLIDVTFLEKDSGLKSIKLLIDDHVAVVKGDDRSKRITYSGNLLSDGPHKVKVEAIDYARWSVQKEWNFTVDTRRIVVNLAERKLYYYANGSLQREYGVAVGMPGWSTPTGSFQIVSKQVNPSWYNPGSSWAVSMPKYIGPGPNNPLGLRAMGINSPGIYIHGTSNYGSIGTAASHGCIRMRNSEIVDFFPIIDKGVRVYIN